MGKTNEKMVNKELSGKEKLKLGKNKQKEKKAKKYFKGGFNFAAVWSEKAESGSTRHMD